LRSANPVFDAGSPVLSSNCATPISSRIYFFSALAKSVRAAWCPDAADDKGVAICAGESCGHGLVLGIVP
jgi:hypothetical protein